MKVKLQPPSGMELPAFNPILPTSAVTQIMILANPSKVSSSNHSNFLSGLHGLCNRVS